MRAAVQDGCRSVITVHDTAFEPGVAHGGDRLVEALALELVVPAIGLVGRREVREHAVALDAAMEIDAAAKIDDIGIVHADAVHARLDSHVVLAHHAKAHRALPIGERELRGIDGRHEAMLEQCVDRGQGRLAQHHDGLSDSALAQLDTLVHRRHGEHIGPRRVHDLRTRHSTMPLGINLDYAAQMLPWAKQVLKRPHVATKGALVDLDPRPARRRLLAKRHAPYASPSFSRPSCL